MVAESITLNGERSESPICNRYDQVDRMFAYKLDNRFHECIRIFRRNRVIETGLAEPGEFCRGEYSTVRADRYPMAGSSR